MTLNIRKFWQQNRPELDNVLEAGEFTANTTAAGLGLAIALGVVNPVVGLTAAGLAFTGSIRKVIELAVKRWNKKLTLEEVVALAAPLAYLESFESCLQCNSILKKKISKEQNQENQVDKKIEIENLILDRELAANALRNFHSSELAQTFNQILSSQLIKQRLSQLDAKVIVSWVAWEAGRYLKEAVDEYSNSSESVIIGIYKNANQEEDSSSYKSIENYLEEQIATKPKEKVFNENFSFADIYVPLKATLVNANGKVNRYQKYFVNDWATEMLLNSSKAKQVMFIQGGPGRGKSVFCRMFADWVRQEIHPLWIPVLIRLRDIESFEPSFEKTLQGAVKADFARNDSWLTDSKFRFLFLLDGFDELRMEGRAKGGIERFIKQVGSFQERCDTSEMGHRFIVTGRQLALQGISYLPENLERVELLEMDDYLQKDWVNKWEKVVGILEDLQPNTIPLIWFLLRKYNCMIGILVIRKFLFNIGKEKSEAFWAFLQSDNLPQEVKQDLAREPLLLYLLAAMHRDGKITIEDLTGTSGIQTKIGIYEQALNWVLTEQRKDRHKDVQPEVVRLKPEQLRQVLMEAGLSVVQSGGECSMIKTIEQRLSKSKPKIANKIQEIRITKGDKVLKNALAAFYLKPASKDEEGAVEFFHKSFGEFLCAKRMQQSIERWTRWDDDEDEFYLDKKQLAEEIFDLLGYGGLTPEIVEYLFSLLAVSNKVLTYKLFNRLEDFYLRWCDGKFINAPPDNNYPQQKMRLLKEQKLETTKKQDILGLRQVDLYTGLNVMILLLQLHRYAQQQENSKKVINFHPCGKLNEEGKLEEEDSSRLFRIIGYCRCLSDLGFLNIVGRFLGSANLSNADLSLTNLSSANLSNADLSLTNLSLTNLSSANLNFANLSSANLNSANLNFANLNFAKLISAKLNSTNLSSANLSSANLSSANLSSANLSSANLSNADLISAKLISANLISANLISANLSSADLFTANLSKADLGSANLSNASLIEANLNSADLSSTKLSSANLNSADLSSTKLSSASLIAAKLISAKLSFANLSSSNLSNASLIEANLSSSNLSNADLSKAKINKANISFANLSSANLSSANLSNADLSKANLRYADLSNADFQSIRWNENTNLSTVLGLKSAVNVPESLKQQILQ